ncbi:hypothetical protein GQ597_11775 [Gilliamella sp. Pra-s65]|uniref:replication initiation protein n=1 Tax=Gilliamella sp. Pra-s65 TaxID=2687316 RepID=UPI00136677EC|nr:replication initiation protein [Gilliamella sp. Pra-s65]MWN91372.1 hypothetical protein [Gilliamella sp. Pra-s65]
MYNNNNLHILKSQLPNRPYCSDDLQFGLQIQLKNKALCKRYLQINNPAVQHSFIFDIDIDNCFYNWEKNNAPPPNIIIKNKQNGRCHYIYQLAKGIYKNRFASLKATKYAAAIESGLCLKLEADLQYVGLVAKNPFSSFWQTEIVEDNLYTLDYLADFVDLSKPKERQESHGLGRNCNLFDDLRQLAYRKKRNFDDLDKFFNYLLLHATNINNSTNTNNLLMFSEVKAIARSVSKWCFKHFDVIESDRKFSKLQAYRSNKRKAVINKNILLNEVLRNGR